MLLVNAYALKVAKNKLKKYATLNVAMLTTVINSLNLKNMDQHIAPFIAIIILFIVIAVVIINWFNYRLKKRIIDSGPIDADAISFLKRLSDMGLEQLKWGAVLFSGGLGLVILNYLPYDSDSPLPYGLEIMFIAAGFLAYYFFVRKVENK
jgi:hypothetical protein